MTRSRIVALTAGVALIVSGLMAAGAGANYHLVKIREVHKGATMAGDYVMLQMYAAGQNIFATHNVRFLDGTGSVVADYDLTNVPNGESQRTYLLGNSVSGADQNEAGVYIGADGAVCYNELNGGGLASNGIDCVSWGNFTPTGEPLSSPAQPNALTGLGGNQSLVRTITRGCATALDSADDTDNSAADFSVGAAIGRSNAGVPTEKLCTTTQKQNKCKKKKKKKGKGKAAAAKKKKKKKCKKKKK